MYDRSCLRDYPSAQQQVNESRTERPVLPALQTLHRAYAHQMLLVFRLTFPLFPTSYRLPQTTFCAIQQECGGAGGVLDSVLDIVGQCTPPPQTKAGGQRKAPVLSAGCGAADAHTIRTNCCALISLLASAVLVTAATATTGSSGAENASHTDICGLEKSVDVGDEGGSAAPNNSGDHVGGGSEWDTFVPMSAKPNPDVVCLVRKKGWAARLQKQIVQPKAVAVTSGSTRSRPPGVNGRVKKQQRRACRNPGAASGDNGNSCGSPVRPGRSALSKVDLAMPLGQRPKGLVQVPQAFHVAPSNRAGRNENSNRRTEGNDRSSGDNTSGSAFAEGDAYPSGEHMQYITGSDSRQPHPHHHQSMSDYLASPPRLSRVNGSGVPALVPLSPRWLASSARHQEVTPLGLSNPGSSNQTSAAKVITPVGIGRNQGCYCYLLCGRAQQSFVDCFAVDSYRNRRRR